MKEILLNNKVLKWCFFKTNGLNFFTSLFTARVDTVFQPLMSAKAGFLFGAWQQSVLYYWSLV